MPYKQEYFREVYNIRHLASELGGMIKSGSILASILIMPISRFFLYQNLMSKLFYVDTPKEDLMTKPKDELYTNTKRKQRRLKYLPKFKMTEEIKNDSEFHDKIKNHKMIYISTFEKLCNFLFYYIPFLKFICKWKKSRDLVLLYRKGKKKIDKELNVVRLVNNLNIIKTFMKNSILTEKMQWLVAHSANNVIDLDCSSSFDDLSSSNNDSDEID